MHLKPAELAALALALALASSVSPANPFIGKWKIDEAKSHLTGTTDSVAASGPNAWSFQDGAFSSKITADGTDQPTSLGTTAMKVVNATTWEFTNKSNGKTISTETWVLSADGQSMQRTFRVPNANGEMSSGSETVKRTAGTSGFEGTWESTELKMTFTEVDVEPNGDDGVTLRLPEDGTHYSLKFDGKDYPEEGPRLPAGMTVSAKMTGPRSITAVTKLNGTAFDSEDWEISADGQTFTYTQLDVGSTDPAVIVLHRLADHR
jgi:hypothetical protein